MNVLMWAAGLFVGEGSVVVVTRPPKKDGSERKYINLAVAMTDERAVRRFYDAVQPHIRYTRKIVQSDLYSYVPKRPGSLRVYRYAATGTPALSICEALYPYLSDSDKGDQMKRCMEQFQ
jgi:hypothetical protein